MYYVVMVVVETKLYNLFATLMEFDDRFSMAALSLALPREIFFVSFFYALSLVTREHDSARHWHGASLGASLAWRESWRHPVIRF